MRGASESEGQLSGDAVLTMLAALANPHRLRVIAALSAEGRNYISRLARELGMSRPLLHLHLSKLQEAGLVTSRLELSADGKAQNWFEVADFHLDLSPSTISELTSSLSRKTEA